MRKKECFTKVGIKPAFVKHVGAFSEEFFYDDEQDPDQEHQHGNFVNSVHHAQVKIGFPVGVFLAEEIA
jgi:hypothetical protein